MKKLTVYSDGGSRGNPGPSACAFVVIDGNKVLHEASFYLGKSTNNRAEYQGVTNALDWVFANEPNAHVVFYLDSELVVKQLNKEYRVKDAALRKMAAKLWSKAAQLTGGFAFRHVPRKENKVADRLLNEELDKYLI